MVQFFDEIEVGQRRPRSPRRTITERDIENYLDFSGDWYGHWTAAVADEEHFEATRFGEDRKTVPGMLLVSLQYGLRTSAAPHRGIVALYLWEEINYLRPVRAGDSIYVEWEAIGKKLTDDGYGVLRTKRTIKNQRDEVVMTIVERSRYRTRAAWNAMQQEGVEPLREKKRDA